MQKNLIWFGLAVLARLMPHPANLTPFDSLVMVSGRQLSKQQTLLVTLLGLLVSDVLLAVTLGYPIFGSWTLFTYSGFALMAFCSVHMMGQQPGALKTAGFTVSAVLLYWLWTNFGTWLVGGLYPHTTQGLMACLVVGLPFLKASLISAVVFVPLFLGILVGLEKICHFKTS